MIQAHWFSSSQTVTLGAANFAGYLIGAMAGRPLVAKLSNRSALRLLMAAVTIAFFACAWPVSVSWFFFWRLLSGFSGGAIVVLVATSILPHIPAPRRGFASGMISRATTAFALFQALGGYGYSYLFSRLHNDYALVFLCGAGALALAIVADVLVRTRRTEQSGREPAVR
ncbi:MFS transporter [Paraburkholderia sp. CNPSo 3274]|nr:MFS transporter [Paraburkholderia sp. CNPSo 3274]